MRRGQVRRCGHACHACARLLPETSSTSCVRDCQRTVVALQRIERQQGKCTIQPRQWHQGTAGDDCSDEQHCGGDDCVASRGVDG